METVTPAYQVFRNSVSEIWSLYLSDWLALMYCGNFYYKEILGQHYTVEATWGMKVKSPLYLTKHKAAKTRLLLS
jgi:hypothetical protein